MYLFCSCWLVGTQGSVRESYGFGTLSLPNTHVQAKSGYIHFWTFMTIVSPLPSFFDRGDLMAMNFHSNNSPFKSAFTVFRIYNAYSTITGSTSQHILTPEDLFPTHTSPSLTVSTLNINHHLSNPTRLLSHFELNVSSQYFEIVADRLYILLNTPGVFTRFPFD